MIYKPVYFELEELVCPHIFYKWGDWVWQFFDERILKNLDWIRERNGPVFVNNWDQPEYLNSDYVMYIRNRIKTGMPIVPEHVPDAPAGLYDERGVRCNLCDLVVKKSKAGVLYITPHVRWQAVDFDVQGRTAEEMRQWIVTNQAKLPYPVRLEKGVSWVHMDVVQQGEMKVQLINP
jgi:hypothetical protein